MNFYQNIKLQPDDEIDIAFLRNKIYTKLHKAFFDLSATDIGVSFPCLKKAKKNDANATNFGDIIRIHSTQKKLQQLQNLNWLGGLSGYCKVSAILPVPNKVSGHQVVSRIRQTMTDAKLKKRLKYQQQKGDLTSKNEVQVYVRQYKNKMFSTGLDSPYLELQSASTGNKYRLYIDFGELQKQAVEGDFNRFGLGNIATIPVFPP